MTPGRPFVSQGGPGFAGSARLHKCLLQRLKNPYVRSGRICERINRELTVLNRFDPYPSSSSEAEVKYLDGDFRVIRPGGYVRCAVTGVPIPLEELRYWSVERQEAYANPQAVLQRLFPSRAS
jgi:hypothetical protein